MRLLLQQYIDEDWDRRGPWEARERYWEDVVQYCCLECVMHFHYGAATAAVWHTHPRRVRPVRWRAKPLRVMSVMTPGL
jgi:hypothetical protein